MINFSFSGFALAVAITLLLCWLVYKLLFEYKVQPSINRTILLTIYGLALITPIISSFIRLPISKGIIKIGQLSLADLPSENLPIINGGKSGLNIMTLFEYIYLIGIGIMLVITCISVLKLYKIKRHSTKIKINGNEVYIHGNRNLASFSWFNHIFLYENVITHDTFMLLEHELAHIRKRHWVDLIISQLFLIFQWFNPIVWFMKKELQQIHEYQADAKVIKNGYDEKTYQAFLLRNITHIDYPYLSDGFNNCSIKKRLFMMKKRHFKTNCLLRFLVLIISLVIGGAILYVPAFATIIQAPTIFSSSDERERINISSREEDSNHSVIIVNNGRIIKNPVYEGGEEKLNRDLAMRLRYPYNAYQDNIQGTVVVQFKVTAKGELTDFKIEKSVNTELDVAAVNAIKDLPGRWSPGEIEGHITSVSYSLPITFKIE